MFQVNQIKVLGMALLSAVLVTAVAEAKSTRKVAMAGGCVALNTPLVLDTNQKYTDNELSMMRNSIYAGYGFKFKDTAIANEMARRGCLKTDVTYSADKLTAIDRQNARLIQSYEVALKEEEQMTDFNKAWAKTMGSRTARAKMLTGHYCYLSDSKKYFGILYFSEGKGRSELPLSAMTDIQNPTLNEDWLGEGDYTKENMNKRIADRSLDTTAAGVIDFATKGSWSVVNGKLGAVVQLNLSSKHRNLSKAQVNIEARNYAENRMLECTIAE